MKPIYNKSEPNMNKGANKTTIMIFLIPLFILFLSISGYPQDSLSVKNTQNLKPASADSLRSNDDAAPKEKGFVDKDGDGINDNKQKKKKKKVDQFIDLDGDGINDGEESAIGLKKAFQNRKRLQKQKGKN